MQVPGSSVLAVGAVGVVSGVALGWPYLPEAWRRRLSLLTSLAGLAFLIAAVNSEGLRESATVRDFLLSTPAVLTPTAASASLPYYLLTAVCLLLGVTGLAVGERAAETLRRHYLVSAVGLTIAVALLRFGFEKAAAPWALSRLFGVVWLPLSVGAFLYFNLRGAPRVWGRVARALLVYALATRGFVVALYAAATTLRLGSHFDVTPVVHITAPFRAEFVAGSAGQFLGLVLLPQLTFWVAYTLGVGLLGALLARAVEPFLHAAGAAAYGPAAREAGATDTEVEEDQAHLAAPADRLKV